MRQSMKSPTPSPSTRQATPTQLRWWVGNSLTLLRLLAGLAYPLVMISWRIPLLLFAGISDAVDGWLARRLNAVSLLGQVLDPIADKLCVLTILGTALWEQRVTGAELLLIGTRDVLVIGVALLAMWTRPGSWKNMPPRILGKAATAGQFLYLVTLEVWNWHPWPFVVLVGGLSLAAGLDYVAAALRYFRNTRPATVAGAVDSPDAPI